jgi:hypothetical protein
MLSVDILNAVDVIVNTTSTNVDFESSNISKQKYITTTKKVGNILFSLGNRFWVLNVGGIKVSSYRTLYFDTWNCCFFNDYLQSNPIRNKIRLRHLDTQNRHFFEVKVSDTNRKKQLKKRIEIESAEQFITTETKALLNESVGVTFDQITPILESRFKRITLVDHKNKQRVTLDMDPVFTNSRTGVSIGVPELVIIESKWSNGVDPIAELVSADDAQKSDISRYMTGMLATNPSTKRTTPKLNK